MPLITGEKLCPTCHTMNKYYYLLGNYAVERIADITERHNCECDYRPDKKEYTVFLACKNCGRSLTFHCDTQTHKEKE